VQGSGLNDRGEFTETERGEIGQTDRRCRISTIKDVAEELHRHWKSVKTLEKQYMRAQLRRVGTPARALSGSTRSRSARDTRTG